MSDAITPIPRHVLTPPEARAAVDEAWDRLTSEERERATACLERLEEHAEWWRHVGRQLRVYDMAHEARDFANRGDTHG